jgi:copper chaperone NosL
MVVIGLAAAACGSGDASGPPEIEFGRDLCVECGMIIQDPRFASAYRLADGTEKVFDDVGDMVIHVREAGDDVDGDAAWVYDFETEEPVVVDAAYFVPTVSRASPMGHSILAFADEERARAFADDVGAEVIGWSDVMAMSTHEGLLGEHHDNGGDGDAHGG